MMITVSSTILSISCLLLSFTVLSCQGQTAYVCDNEPCQNGGTCLINSQDPSEFLCNCADFFNGTFCENYLGPTDCGEHPCLNGGTCFQGSDNIIWCQCPDRYTGALCHKLDVSPCVSNPCQNDGICTLHDGGYSCSCVAGFAGATCSLSITTRCAMLPCENGGTCFVSSFDVQQYYCVCPVGFYGDHCHLPVTSCSCENGGQCRNINLPGGGIGLACDCPLGYSGPRCEVAPSNVCDEQPCGHGNCFLHATNQSEYYCSCFDGYSGDDCSVQVTPGSCSDNPCQNYGSCSSVIAGSGTEYTRCHCPPGYTGFFCERSSEGCSPNPCLNGGLCLASSPTTVTCQCHIGFVGARCQYRGACSSSPCQNNGTCYNAFEPQRDLPQFACDCQGEFRGLTCNETADPCTSNPCLNGGVCLKNVNGDAYVCLCPPEYVGAICHLRQDSLCAANPSACNGPGEVCIDHENYFHCECQPDWTRNDNDTACHRSSVGPCDSCKNGGTCVIHSNAIYCECVAGYSGIDCSDQVTTVRPGSSVGQCDSCKNGATCVMHSNAFYCECVAGYSGIDCSDQVTTVRPGSSVGQCDSCKNGATCVMHSNAFYCECVAGYSGIDCSDQVTTVRPGSSVGQCDSCKNGATCVMHSNAFYCECVAGYSGIDCSDQVTTVRPGSSVGQCDSCKNGAACVMYSNAFYCECVAGYSGIDCSDQVTTVRPDDPCFNHTCQNGGTCQPFDQMGGYHCLCPEGFSGLNCSTHVTTTPALKTTQIPTTTKVTSPPGIGICESGNPCKNDAQCIPVRDRDGDFYPMCLCSPGFAGSTCSVTLPITKVCLSKPCGPDAQCFSNATSLTGYSCRCLRQDGLCSDNIISEVTVAPTVPPCESNPCMNNGTCVEVGHSFTCTCPPYIVGDTCESDIRECSHMDSIYREGDIRYDGCIKCNCSNGDWQCSEDTCYCEHEEKLYENGQTWTDRCMTCFCYNGGWLCSDANCSNTCLYQGERYFSGDIREESCQTCFCNSGNWTCTEKECDYCLDDSNTVYFEGSVRRDDCNLCTCTEKEWSCTVKDCDDLPLVLAISFHLNYPFSLVSDRQDQLIRVIKAHLEARYDLQMNQLVEIVLSEGSVVVNITLLESLATDQDIRYVASQIKHKVSSGSLKVAFDGFMIPAKIDSYSETIIISGNEPSPDPTVFFIILTVGMLFFTLFVIIVFGVFLCWKSKKSRRRSSSQRRRLFRSRESESSEDIPPTATWDNSGADNDELESPVMLNFPHSKKVMTCPGRLRQKGLEAV